MLLHHALRAVSVPALNGSEQLFVLTRDAPVPRVRFRQECHRVVQLHPDLFDRMREHRIAGRTRHRDVEVGVVPHVLGLCGGGDHTLDCLAHRRHIWIATRCGRRSRHRRLDEASVLQQVFQLFAMAHHAQDQLVRRQRVVAQLCDERAPVSTAPRFDQPRRLQHPERVLDRRPADAEHHGQLTLGRQRLPDVTANLLGHVFMCPQLLDPLEADARRDLRSVGLNGHAQPPGSTGRRRSRSG